MVRFLLLLITVLIICPPAFSEPFSAEQFEFFEKKVRPVLMENCFKCHGGDKVESGLRVDDPLSLLKGGDSGHPAIVPFNAKKSLLLQAIKKTHPDFEMPPKGALSQQSIDDIEKWINTGAPWPISKGESPSPYTIPGKDLWSLKPPAKITPPEIKNITWAKSPIDHFIRAKLENKNITPAPQADKRTLIRRATFDLTGLPPTPKQVEKFLNDQSPYAFAILVDRLLASEDYGKRWGRHWLDLARYADTAGDATDMPIPEAHKYRDYVIDAFNSDMPYDQFIIEQIAGDILAFENPEDRFRQRVIATGFVALARRFKNSKNADFHLIVDNTLDTIGKSMLGLSISCARCHNHKFDPISQQDYYSLYGFFSSTRYPHAGTEHQRERSDFVPLTTDLELQDQYDQLSEKRNNLFSKIKGHRDSRKNPLLKKIQELKSQSYTLLNKIDRSREKGNDTSELKNQLEELNEEISRTEKKNTEQRKQWEDELTDLRKKLDVELAWAVIDKKDNTTDAKMLIAGDSRRPGKTVPRGFINIITSEKPDIPENQSGRLQLAQWIASPKNPLTARVMANRIWQYHFGTGIVATSNGFGTQGKAPSHPKLLDFLANQFIENQWSIKKMHRLIMNSATYQMAGLISEKDNPHDLALLYRYPSRRLDAEAIRDTILFVSNTLDTSPAGAHDFPPNDKLNYTQHRPFFDDYDHNKRTVYLMRRRLGNHAFLALFDGPDTNNSTANRTASTIPQQALFMMNNDFVEKNAKSFAKNLLKEYPDPQKRLIQAYEIAYTRSPAPKETKQALEYINRYQQKLPTSTDPDQKSLLSWTSYCRILMSANEFIYID